MLDGRRRCGSLIAALAVAGALALASCASAPAPEVEMPTAAQRRAAEAAGFELPPVRETSELVPPELLQGPHYTLADKVYTDGYIHVFTIVSDFGVFHARGDDVLAERLREVQAIAAIEEMSATKEFATAAGKALASPFVATWNLITHPVDSIVGIPKGAWEAMRRTAAIAGSDRGELEDNAVTAFIGFEGKKRQIAGELGVDPYSSNPVLQKQLNRFAWAAYAGGLPSMFVPFSNRRSEAADDPAAVTTDDRVQQLLREYSPEDLDRLNRIELAVMGVPKPLSEEFIEHPWYSPRYETVLIENLSALDLTQDRQTFIEVALTAESESDAHFHQRNAELMRRYNDDVGHIDKILSVAGTVTGFAADGTLVVPFAADHAVWSPSTAAFADSVTQAVPGDIAVRKTELLLSGTLSPLARANLESRGVAVTDRAFDRLQPHPPGSAKDGG